MFHLCSIYCFKGTLLWEIVSNNGSTYFTQKIKIISMFCKKGCFLSSHVQVVWLLRYKINNVHPNAVFRTINDGTKPHQKISCFLYLKPITLIAKRKVCFKLSPRGLKFVKVIHMYPLYWIFLVRVYYCNTRKTDV